MIIFDPSEFMRSGAGPAAGSRAAGLWRRTVSFLRCSLRMVLRRPAPPNPADGADRPAPAGGGPASGPVLPASLPKARSRPDGSADRGLGDEVPGRS